MIKIIMEFRINTMEDLLEAGGTISCIDHEKVIVRITVGGDMKDSVCSEDLFSLLCPFESLEDCHYGESKDFFPWSRDNARNEELHMMLSAFISKDEANDLFENAIMTDCVFSDEKVKDRFSFAEAIEKGVTAVFIDGIAFGVDSDDTIGDLDKLIKEVYPEQN